MNRYLIHAFENQYGGLHGMENWVVEEFEYDKEAYDYAADLSYDVMDSYSCIEEDLTDDLDLDTDEGQDEYEQRRVENVSYQVWLIKNTCKLTTKELDNMCSYDPDLIVEKYVSERVN